MHDLILTSQVIESSVSQCLMDQRQNIPRSFSTQQSRKARHFVSRIAQSHITVLVCDKQRAHRRYIICAPHESNNQMKIIIHSAITVLNQVTNASLLVFGITNKALKVGNYIRNNELSLERFGRDYWMYQSCFCMSGV